jgi:hypothetical protein
VIAAVTSAFPHSEWHERSATIESVFADADPIIREMYASLSTEMRFAMDQQRTQCTVKCQGATLELYGFDEEPVQEVLMNIRGVVIPIRDFDHLTQITGWVVVTPPGEVWT